MGYKNILGLNSGNKRREYSIIYCSISLISLIFFLFFPSLNSLVTIIAAFYIYILMIFLPTVASIWVRYFRPTVILFLAYLLSLYYATYLSTFLLVPLVIINSLLVAKDMSEPRSQNMSEPPSQKRKLILRVTFIGALITVLILALILWQLSVFEVGKPAVYLYPEKDLQASVKVSLNGRITQSIPEYGQGWKVYVRKGGLIDGKYDYLFYEAALNRLERPSKGWVVGYKDLARWFDEKLPALGLNNAEATELKAYWMNKLPESKYYKIGLLSPEFLKEDMDLVVEPKPDTEIRRIFYFKPLNVRQDIEEPIIPSQERIGFTVVEWGGVVDIDATDKIRSYTERLIG